MISQWEAVIWLAILTVWISILSGYLVDAIQVCHLFHGIFYLSMENLTLDFDSQWPQEETKSILKTIKFAEFLLKQKERGKCLYNLKRP